MNTKRVICAAIFRGGKVLLARRAVGQKHAGYWEFPGGKVEPGETDEACLEREMQEEFGIFGRTGEHIADGVCTFPELDLKIVLCAYVFDWQAGEMQLRVHDQILWADRNTLECAKLTSADAQIAEQVGQILQNLS